MSAPQRRIGPLLTIANIGKLFFKNNYLRLTVVALSTAAWPAGAQPWPARTIRMVVPFAPGGNTDIIARFVAPRMGEDLGQQIIIDNRGGASSTIGTDIAAKAPADGYTLLMVSTAHVINPAVIKKLPYDSVRDFTAITLVADVPNALVVHPSVPSRTLKELITLARSRPNEMLYATPGRGTSTHLAIEMLATRSGLKLVHVPYKGVGPATVDLVAGHVHMQFSAMPSAIQFVRDGRLRMLVQSGAKRSSAAPQVPVMAEAGVPDFVVSSGFGMLAPAHTPRAVVDRIYASVRKSLAHPDIHKGLSTQGAEPVGNTPDEYDRYNRAEIARWSKVARDAGIQPE